MAALTKEKGPQAAELAFGEYSHTWGNKPTKEEIKRAVVEVETDYIFLVPTHSSHTPLFPTHTLVPYTHSSHTLLTHTPHTSV